MTETASLTLPPLMWGEAAPGDALGHAARRAALGCDAGLVAHRLAADHVEAAMVFAPEVPLSEAMTMMPLCAVGFQNALGAIAPPEVAVHFGWDGAIRINGARCGAFRAISSSDDPKAVPDWLVVGFTLPLVPPSEDMGHMPDQTALYAEGCADVKPDQLLEAWARHTLNWITRWEDEGARPLHAEWRGLAHGVGDTVEQGALHGKYLGVDETFGMLLRDKSGDTHLIPLTTLLEEGA